MSIVLKSAIVHILDVSSNAPILSQQLLTLEDEIGDYITTIIKKTFYSDDAKNCQFKPESIVWDSCRSANWDVVTISHSFASEVYNIMRRNKEIPSADTIMGISEIDGIDYFYVLKIDYRTALTHIVSTDKKEINVGVIKHKALMPAQPAKSAESFFINTISPSTKIIEKKYTVDGIKDYYISTQILACSENITPRQKATKIMKAAQKMGELYYDSTEDINVHISSTMLSELNEDHPIVVEKLSQRFFANNPVAQKEFLDILASADIEPNEEISLSEKFQKKYEKQAIRTSSGVEIKIPTQVYSDCDEVEFINNADGTVSLLIKNINI